MAEGRNANLMLCMFSFISRCPCLSFGHEHLVSIISQRNVTEPKRKRNDFVSPRKRIDISVGSKRTKDFLFLSSPFSASVAVETEHNADASSGKLRCSILALAPPLLLCLRQNRFHGDVSDVRDFPLALVFLTFCSKEVSLDHTCETRINTIIRDFNNR